MTVAEPTSTEAVYYRGVKLQCEGPGDSPFSMFESTVLAVHGNMVQLTLPRDRDIDRLCPVGEKLSIHRDAQETRYSAVCVRVRDPNERTLTIRIINGPKRVERREYLRVRCELPTEWSIIAGRQLEEKVREIREGRNEEHSLGNDVERLRMTEAGRALLLIVEKLESLEARLDKLERGSAAAAQARDIVADISGSGFRFLTGRSVHTGEYVFATIYFEGQSPDKMEVVGQIVRIDLPNLGRAQTAVACHFVAMSDTDREALIRFTFRVQREQVRNSPF